ncbi:MAG: efflux RND transporter periplasmic adaptor subunit, partial [Pseudomonadota bacterium]
RARAEIGLRLARLAVDDAERALAETEMRAPFAGLLTDVAAAPGRRVSANERLAVLVDPTRLEAAFPVSNAEYARLLDATGALAERPARVSLETGDGQAAEMPAQLIRAGAAAGAGRTGRTLFARLTPEAGRLLREGDFVAVRLQEPPMEKVAVLPAAAATEDGRILVVGEDDRLEERAVSIQRRQGDRLVVAGAPFGARVVAVRKPQLGPGVKVEVLGPAGAPAGGAEDRLAAAEGDFIALSEDRRARLVRLVRADAELAEAEKARLLDHLSAPRAPRDVVERLEARASGG